jgi:hypothetical protein
MSIEIISKENNMKLLRYNNTICRLPNWIFNEPYVEKELLEEEIDISKNSKPIDIRLLDVYQNKYYPISVPIHITSDQLKEEFFKLDQKYNPLEVQIRLIYNGCEIKSTHTLYQHQPKHKGVIQVIVNKNVID